MYTLKYDHNHTPISHLQVPPVTPLTSYPPNFTFSCYFDNPLRWFKWETSPMGSCIQIPFPRWWYCFWKLWNLWDKDPCWRKYIAGGGLWGYIVSPPFMFLLFASHVLMKMWTALLKPTSLLYCLQPCLPPWFVCLGKCAQHSWEVRRQLQELVLSSHHMIKLRVGG